MLISYKYQQHTFKIRKEAGVKQTATSSSSNEQQRIAWHHSKIDMSIFTSGIQAGLGDCYDGLRFQNAVEDMLKALGFTVQQFSTNDNGVDLFADIIQNINGEQVKKRFYIQCKYWNKAVGKSAICEVFTGSYYYKNAGSPAVVTNNRVTKAARDYAKALGVEIIADKEWREIKSVSQAGTIKIQRSGLLAVIEGIITSNSESIKIGMQPIIAAKQATPDPTENQTKELLDLVGRGVELQSQGAELIQRAIAIMQSKNDYG